MWEEILKIIPKIDAATLSKMEKTLSNRFARAAKSLGKGLIATLAGGGIIGSILAIAEKILNPLKEVQETIEKLLESSRGIVENAKQFGAQSGELFRLQKMAQASGMAPEELNQLLVKYQAAVAQAKADPSKDTSVRRYANDKDMVASFFQFIQSLNTLPAQKQVLVEQEVFGEKQTLRVAEFLRTDFDKLSKQMNLLPAEMYTKRLDKDSDLAKMATVLQAKGETNSFVKNSDAMNAKIIADRDAARQREADKETRRLQSYDSLAAVEKTTDSILDGLDKLYLKVNDFAVNGIRFMDNATGFMEKIKSSRAFRVTSKFFGD